MKRVLLGIAGCWAMAGCSPGAFGTLSKEQAQAMLTEAVFSGPEAAFFGPNNGVHMARINYGVKSDNRPTIEWWLLENGFMAPDENGGTKLLNGLVSVSHTGPAAMVVKKHTTLIEEFGQFHLEIPITKEGIEVSSVSTDGKQAKAFWKPTVTKLEPVYGFICGDNSLASANSSICAAPTPTGPDVYATFEKADDGEWRLLSPIAGP